MNNKLVVLVDKNKEITVDKTLSLTNISEVELSTDRKEFIHLDKLPSGEWRLVYTKGTIDIDTFKCMVLKNDETP